MGAGHVEAAQDRDPPRRIGGVRVAQHPLGPPLAVPVGAVRPRHGVLRERRGRRPVDRCRRGEREHPHAMRRHPIHQYRRAAHVVVVVAPRLRERRPGGLERRQVHHRREAARPEHRIERRRVADVAFDEPRRPARQLPDRPDGLTPRVRQVVEQHHLVPARQQLQRDVAADEAGPAGHQHLHRARSPPAVSAVVAACVASRPRAAGGKDSATLSTSSSAPLARTLPASSSTPVEHTRRSISGSCDTSTTTPAPPANASRRRYAFSRNAPVPDHHPLVHQQDLGLKAGAHREPEPEPHPRRVGVHRHGQVVAELGERRDLPGAFAHLGKAQPDEQPAGHDVLVAAGLVVEPERHVEQRADPPVGPHPSRRRLVDPRQHPKQRRLAGAVAAEHADPVAVAEGEAHPVERAHRQRPPVGADEPSRPAMHERLAQRARARAEHRQLHRHRVHAERRHARHSQYAMRPRQRT